MKKEIEYRKDIQILRGVAVLLVVLYHLGLAGFHSGFLGVDVFFVISGYLMAIMYDPSKKMEFFVKRAKRLLPAYFAVVIATLLLSIVVTTPLDYRQVADQATFATFFASNVGFWVKNSYFDRAAFNPLLHLWSLGVELQFYASLPVLYLVFKKAKASYPLVLIVSALLCFFVLGVSPKTSFFWMPLRLWEFLLGYGVVRHIDKGRAAKTEMTTWLGAAALLAIISIPFITMDEDALGFIKGQPGLIALIICLATTVILSFGLPKMIEDNPVAGLMERIGEYSYSIYLAHFPVIVVFLYQPFSGTVLKAANGGQTAILAVLTICASALLFVYVEQPFRANKGTMRWVFVSGIVVLALIPLGMLVQNSFISEKEMLVYQAWFDRDEYRCGKIKRIIHPFAISCEITEPINDPSHRVLLVGNSHADSIKATFSSVAQSRNVSVYFMVENNPLMKGGTSPESLIHEAQARSSDSIVLHYSPGGIDYRTIYQLALLAKEKSIKLSFIMPVPVWDENVPMMLLRSQKGLKELPSRNIDNYRDFNSGLLDGIAKIKYDHFRVYQIADVFCRSDCQLVSKTGKPLYFDGGHLTMTGSEMMRKVFDRLIADLS